LRQLWQGALRRGPGCGQAPAFGIQRLVPRRERPDLHHSCRGFYCLPQIAYGAALQNGEPEYCRFEKTVEQFTGGADVYVHYFSGLYAFDYHAGNDMAQAHRAPPHPLAGVAPVTGKKHEIVQNHGEKLPVCYQSIHDRLKDADYPVNGIYGMIPAYFMNDPLQVCKKLLYRIIENFRFVSEIKIEGGSGNFRADGNFLHCCIFKSFFDKNFQGFSQYLPATPVMFNRNCHKCIPVFYSFSY
jgi:hypothetical protein